MPSQQNLSIPLHCPDGTTKSESISRGYEHKACYYVEILSDPPEAHVTDPYGRYWGDTQVGVPVEGYFSCTLNWNESNQIWNLPDGWTSAYQFVTFTLEKRGGYKATSKSFWIGPYSCIGAKTPPEELISQGLLGKLPDKKPENTIRVMVVLDTLPTE